MTDASADRSDIFTEPQTAPNPNVDWHSKRIKKHTNFIKKLKFGIIISIVTLIMVLILWPIINKEENKFNITMQSKEIAEVNESPKMAKPRFYGIDENNNPYNLTADEAEQDGMKYVLLKVVSGDVMLKDGTWVAIISDSGKIDVSKKQLKLTGSVNIFVDTGYEVFTESAQISLEKGIVEGDEEVLVRGPQGALRANGFSLKDNGKNMEFKGRVRMVSQEDSPARGRVKARMDKLRAQKTELYTQRKRPKVTQSMVRTAEKSAQKTQHGKLSLKSELSKSAGRWIPPKPIYKPKYIAVGGR